MSISILFDIIILHIGVYALRFVHAASHGTTLMNRQLTGPWLERHEAKRAIWRMSISILSDMIMFHIGVYALRFVHAASHGTTLMNRQLTGPWLERHEAKRAIWGMSVSILSDMIRFNIGVYALRFVHAASHGTTPMNRHGAGPWLERHEAKRAIWGMSISILSDMIMFHIGVDALRFVHAASHGTTLMNRQLTGPWLERHEANRAVWGMSISILSDMIMFHIGVYALRFVHAASHGTTLMNRQLTGPWLERHEAKRAIWGMSISILSDMIMFHIGVYALRFVHAASHGTTLMNRQLTGPWLERHEAKRAIWGMSISILSDMIMFHIGVYALRFVHAASHGTTLMNRHVAGPWLEHHEAKRAVWGMSISILSDMIMFHIGVYALRFVHAASHGTTHLSRQLTGPWLERHEAKRAI